MTSSTTTRPASRSPGRPREFDIGEALDAALLVFREHGFHAASLGSLGAAMKLTPGSIYKAFDDKRAIFLAAFDRYVDHRHARLQPLLDAEPDGLGKVAALLRFYAESAQGIEGRRGCLVVGGIVELANHDAATADRVTASLDRLEAVLRQLILTGQADGSISRDIDAEPVIHTLVALLQGLRVVGKLGRDRDRTMETVHQALRLLQPPSRSPS